MAFFTACLDYGQAGESRHLFLKYFTESSETNARMRIEQAWGVHGADAVILDGLWTRNLPGSCHTLLSSDLAYYLERIIGGVDIPHWLDIDLRVTVTAG